MSIDTTRTRALLDLAAVRREHREISPKLSDALDMAMESLHTALTIMELEGRDDG